jgi:hypothetical protein
MIVPSGAPHQALDKTPSMAGLRGQRESGSRCEFSSGQASGGFGRWSRKGCRGLGWGRDLLDHQLIEQGVDTGEGGQVSSHGGHLWMGRTTMSRRSRLCPGFRDAVGQSPRRLCPEFSRRSWSKSTPLMRTSETASLSRFSRRSWSKSTASLSRFSRRSWSVEVRDCSLSRFSRRSWSKSTASYPGFPGGVGRSPRH